MLEVRLHCGLCGEEHTQEIPMPEGWASRYESVSDETAFCPKHAIVAKFADSQCPGCVGGWGDCPLWQSFAYSKLKLTSEDFRTLEAGICPKRVNGTMMSNVSREGATCEQIDLRGPHVDEAGKALVHAIREYVVKFHKPSTYGDKPA